MQLKVVCCILLALTAVCWGQTTTTSSTDVNWNGLWTDPFYGGQLSTCFRDNEFWAFYSDIGWMEGTISADNRTVRGEWFESGYTDFVWGGFQMTMSLDQGSFSGNYWLNLPHDRCHKSTFTATRISSFSTPIQCVRPPDDEDEDISGVWYDLDSPTDKMWLCVSDDGNDDETAYGWYTASYYTAGVQEFSWGRTWDRAQSAQGSYYSFNAAAQVGVPTGIELFRLNLIKQITNARYSVPSTASANFTNLATHSVRTWVKSTEVATFANCSAHSYLKGIQFQGAWTDGDFGEGRLYICQNSTLGFEGIYSEVGWVDGAQNSSLIAGSFYDAGNDTLIRGSLSLAIANDGHHFEGFWQWENDTRLWPWKDYRVSVLTPSNAQCLLLDTSTDTAAGRWQYGTGLTDFLDICFFTNSTANYFEASYNFDNGLGRGYMVGRYADGGKALQSAFYEPGSIGIDMWRMTGVGRLDRMRWPDRTVQTVDFFYCDDEDTDNVQFDEHKNYGAPSTYFKLSNIPTQRDCRRNSDLFLFNNAAPPGITDDDEGFTPSGTSNTGSGPSSGPSPNGSGPSPSAGSNGPSPSSSGPTPSGSGTGISATPSLASVLNYNVALMAAVICLLSVLFF